MPQSMLKNPHLEGEAFFWPGGPDGVLLVHGFTATTAEVRPLAQAFQAQGYTVAGPLLPGHHADPRDMNRTTWRDWVRAVEEGYRQVTARCERVVVGGESTGALLALYLASEHPEVSAILAFAPALRLNMPASRRAALYLLAPFVPYVPKPERLPHRPSAVDDLWQGYAVNPLRGTLELLRFQRVVRSRLPRIVQPIFILQGRLDATVDSRAPQMLHDGVRSPVKEIHWMAHSTHCVILDDEREQAFALALKFVEKMLNENQKRTPITTQFEV